ncbi:hypothetical protein IPF37_04675 [bacterium]|nr:MAG: hypothetical protein IPF37_04675 [bacterium]
MKFFRSMNLLIAATCFFGVAQGAAGKNWSNLFDGLGQPDFKVDQPYSYYSTSWTSSLVNLLATPSLIQSEKSARNELTAAGKKDLKAFFDQLFEKLKDKHGIRSEITIQQAENLLKIFKDDTIKKHIIRPQDAEMPAITNSDTNKIYETHLFLDSLISAFELDLATNASIDKQKTYVSLNLFKKIWADADTPTVWKEFFDALKKADFNESTWQENFKNASRNALQELFDALFSKIESQNISSQQIKNFAACLTKDSAIEKSIITNMNGTITLRYQNAPNEIKIINDPAHIIPLIKTIFDKNTDTKDLWSSLVKKQLKSIRQENKEIKKRLEEPAIKVIKTKYEEAQKAYNNATKKSAPSTENQLNQALIALKEKLTHLAYELHRLQNPAIPAFTPPAKSALKEALDAAKAEYDKTYEPLATRQHRLKTEKDTLNALLLKIASSKK